MANASAGGFDTVVAQGGEDWRTELNRKVTGDYHGAFGQLIAGALGILQHRRRRGLLDRRRLLGGAFRKIVRAGKDFPGRDLSVREVTLSWLTISTSLSATALVSSLDEMTQHNAALVEQINASIEQTEAQASELDRIVDIFTLEERESRKARIVAPVKAAAASIKDLQQRVKSAAQSYLSHGNGAVDKDREEF